MLRTSRVNGALLGSDTRPPFHYICSTTRLSRIDLIREALFFEGRLGIFQRKQRRYVYYRIYFIDIVLMAYQSPFDENTGLAQFLGRELALICSRDANFGVLLWG